TSKGEDDTIFISDEGPPPTDEGTLAEILSPVDEVLSYGSADLPSSSKRDLSFRSEDLPPPPLGADAMKNDDSTFSVDDFPPPPEQMTVSEPRLCGDEDVSLQMDVLPPSPDNAGPEEFPLLNQETTGAFSPRGGSISEQLLVRDFSRAKEGIRKECSTALEHQQGEHKTPLQHLELLPTSNPTHGQTSEGLDLMKWCKTSLTLPEAEEGSDDPLLSFEIGDRVLVKQTQPGTLMFKGQTCFADGHWAGVALDRAEGDNAGTYKGVKYFECPQGSGIFVRPDEISHLLGVSENGSSSTGDEDTDSFYDDESFRGHCKYSEDGEQGGGFRGQKAGETKSAGGSEEKETQPRFRAALLSGKEQSLPCSDQPKCSEFLSQNNFKCSGSDKDKQEQTQIKHRILPEALPKRSQPGDTPEVNTSKSICGLVEDQRRKTFTDDIAGELREKLLFEALIAFAERAEHKYKSTFEKDPMNCSRGLRQAVSQKGSPFTEKPVVISAEQPVKVANGLLRRSDLLGRHTVAGRIVTKLVDDAVKEYEKMKREHGSKANRILHLSSEAPPTTLPFLIQILDAGIFGSSEVFNQLHPDQQALARQTQNKCTSDQWHSAPWKKAVDVPPAIPHCSSYVKNLSASAVEELWTPENICSRFRRANVPKHSECNDLPGNDLEAESKRMYNQVIFDLTRELLCAECPVTANPNRSPWMKENLASHCSRPLRRTDIDGIKMFVEDEIIKIMNLEKNDLGTKRKLLNMSKYRNCKRDRVDLILIQELCREESQWTYYDEDELTVKMRVTEDIFNSLILDTIRVLNNIYLRRVCD
ncbi:CE350 protein, partial [Rhinopomastus cyanomelas]|nr:CE350 protein [Rhinopomastus cyanomelas]